jgi:hypothetical protein
MSPDQRPIASVADVLARIEELASETQQLGIRLASEPDARGFEGVRLEAISVALHHFLSDHGYYKRSE